MDRQILDSFKSQPKRACLPFIAISLVLSCLLQTGCAGTENAKRSYFTSGNRDADQRATQFMERREQMAASGQSDASNDEPARAEGKRTLYVRLGGTPGISNIVADFIPRVLDDPRVNWERKAVKTGGFLGMFKQNVTIHWEPTSQNIAALNKHMVQLFALTTGGPSDYDGKPIKSLHAPMSISNPEFDAVLGDLKATLDKLQIPNREQKELLAIVETTRPMIVTKR
jgi:hemoglobin